MKIKRYGFDRSNADEYDTVFERKFCIGSSVHSKKIVIQKALRLTTFFEF